MAHISAATIITSLSLFHVTLAYFFLTSPYMIADQTLVFIVGEAMKLVSIIVFSLIILIYSLDCISRNNQPYSRSFDKQSPSLAFLSCILLLLGISDLVSISQPDEIAQLHWGTQAPIRLLIFFSLTFYSFAFSQSSPLYFGAPYYPSTWGEGLKNRIFFTWSFIETIAWFWVYVTLREERKVLLLRLQEMRTSEENPLQ